VRATILFDNLGPYHIARLTAAAKVCELSAIEINAKSVDYDWRQEPGPITFARRTLFNSEAQPAGNILGSAKALNAAIKETHPDVVLVPGWSSWHAFAALHWCVTNRIPAIVMSESTRDDEPRAAWKEWIKKRYLRMCSAALVGGHRNQDYVAQLGMPEGKIFFGYDVVDNNYFAQHCEHVREDPRRWRTQLNLPERFFLASARFIPKKNLGNLLNAYAAYRAESRATDSCWDLVVLGDGPDRPMLESLRDRLALEEAVHFPGFKQYNELPPYYALAAAFIHPSSVEPWGLVVNEAMAASLPVLVSNRCGCAQSLVCEGENGQTFDPHDPASMAKCMLAMSQASEGARTAMGRRSTEIIADFGPETFADGLRRAAMVAMGPRPKSPGLADILLLKSLVMKSFLPFRSAPAL
jgi:1,2-diacylglycerol 3-alpha-glucosyltransferase